jgi:glycosyltransferase involved in cell wall biosynthesis
MLTALLRNRGIEVTVLSLAEQPERSVGPDVEKAGARVVCIPATITHGLIDGRRFLRVASFIRQGGFDLVQTHLFYANTIGCAAARLCGIPAIATLHDTGRAPRRGTGVKERLEGLVLRRTAASVAAVGEAVAAAHMTKARPGAMVVLPNPVSATASLTPDERRALRREICGDAARPLLISVGRLSVQKGHHVLINAFAVVKHSHPTAVLALAGIGGLHADLCRLVAGLGLEGSVHFLGWRDDVSRLLAAADVYVSASLWEGAPLVILEAAAAGLPVVATDTGETSLVLGDGRGLLVPPDDVTAMADTLGGVLEDLEGARQRFGDAARLFVTEHHDVDGWGGRVLALYGSVAPAVAKWNRFLGSDPVAPPCAG